ncbi:unnamed protein product [Orchesella dallaii]|uniref:MACPF domain-containing protein n=1 Tax=Orchesella dallaii TaxID=48710 RepID=A0ABP1PTK5_9HEXA
MFKSNDKFMIAPGTNEFYSIELKNLVYIFILFSFNDMFVSVQLFFLLGFVEIVFGCNSRKRDDELKAVTVDDPAGEYSLVGGFQRGCEFNREESQRYKLTPINHRSNCVSLPPGLPSIQHGFAREYFSSIKGKQRLRETSFYFNCDENANVRYWKGYRLPNEIKYLTEVPRTLYDRRIVTKKRMLDALSRDAKLSDETNGYLFILPLLRLNLTDSITSAAYLSVQVEGFEIALQNLKPTKQMVFMYQNLPEQFDNNELSYYHFVNSYGTGIIISTIFGGKFQVLVTSDRLKSEIMNTDLTDKASLEGILNQIINVGNEESSRVTMLVEGGGFPASTSRKDIAQWQEHIMNAPVSLDPNIMPIYKFMEPVTTTLRKKGLEKMVHFEEQNQELRKVLYALDILKSHRLSSILKKILEDEIQKVCPSPTVYNVVKNGILESNNIDLTKYNIVCTSAREYSDKYEEEIIVTHLFRLLPGLCFSITGKFPTCSSSRFVAPNGVSCLQFFKHAMCSGAVDKIVQNSGDLTKAFNSDVKSFKFC